MKLNLKLAASRPLSRSEAWGCVTANLAVPGSGSLAAGRAVGYWQMGIYFAGFILTLVGAVGFVHWYYTNTAQFNQLKQDDPGGALLEIFRAARWVMAGFAIFVFALLWSGITSFRILQAPPKASVPPRIS
jgi:hypothetical protein